MKSFYKLILLALLVSNQSIAQPFVTVWNLATPGSSPNGLWFGVGTTGIVNYTWETIPAGTNGSGTFTGTTAIITGLPAGAMIRLAIDTTNFNQIVMYSSLDTNRLLDVEQWGGVHWASMEGAFAFCHNLNITSVDVPDLSVVTSMNSMFMRCTSLDGPSNINLWNTSNVFDMFGVFQGATLFNQPIGNWNTSNVSGMSVMFAFATSFNQSIGNWNLSNLSAMESMFAYATSFNQPLNNWNVSNVNYMNGMFYNAVSFNQPIGNWNTSNVENMNYMFYGALSFNQPLDSLEINNLGGPFQTYGLWQMLSYSGIDCINYSKTLYGWSIKPSTPFYLELGADSLQYGFYAQAARNNLINNKAWIIYGDTLSNTPCCYAMNLNASVDACISYNFNGQILTSSGVYFDSLLSVNGCDSLVTLNLTIHQPTSFGFNDTACTSYFFNGQNLITSGTYYDTLMNVNGCDSIITLSLTINQPTSSMNNQSVCNSYFFNGQTLTTSGTYYDTLLNVNGCDSIISLNLTIYQPTSSTTNQTTCNSYFFNNQNLTSSGVYYDTLINASGCDSILVLNLTINQANSSITQSGANLSANASGATYQWLSCNPYQIISGASNQNFTATANGDYAVVVTENGCTDTSACVKVIGIGLDEISNENTITIYPNPTQDKLYVSIDNSNYSNQAKLEIYNTLGQLLLTKEVMQAAQTELDISGLAKGVYYLRYGQYIHKILLQ